VRNGTHHHSAIYRKGVQTDMFLAEQAAGQSSNFHLFDLFLFAFTVLIFWGIVRLAKEEKRNKFALGFATLSLLVFLLIDFLIVMNWFGQLGTIQQMLFG